MAYAGKVKKGKGMYKDRLPLKVGLAQAVHKLKKATKGGIKIASDKAVLRKKK